MLRMYRNYLARVKGYGQALQGGDVGVAGGVDVFHGLIQAGGVNEFRQLHLRLFEVTQPLRIDKLRGFMPRDIL